MDIEKEWYTCKFCGNDHTLDDGFELSTHQCASCHDYDIQKPAIDKYWLEYEINTKNVRRYIPTIIGLPYLSCGTSDY